MGDRLQPADVLNPKGYWEDLDFQAINKALAGRGYQVREPDSLPLEMRNRLDLLIAKRCEKHAVWGFKNPRACFTLHLIIPILKLHCDDIRMVAVHRRFSDAVASMQRHSEIAYGGQHRMTMKEADALMLRWRKAWQERLDEFDGPTKVFWYEWLIDEPTKTVQELSNFVFEGLPHPTMARIEMAAGAVSRELRRFG
jgi:hypothetical protein